MTAESSKALFLRTFGELRLLDANGEAVAYPEKGLLALCYLFTVPGHARTRRQLSRTLWGDVDKPLVNLRKLLSRLTPLHAALGTEPLRFDGLAVHLNVDAVAADFAELSALAGDRLPADAERVAALYTGEFLGDVIVPDEEARFWLEAQRLKFSDIAIGVLHREAARASALGDFARARDTALRILAINPYDEAASRHLVGTLSSQGRIGEARHIARDFEKKLRTDLGVAPEPRNAPGLRPAPDGGETRQPPQGRRVPRLVLLDAGGAAASALVEDVTIGFCRLRAVAIVAPHSARALAVREADEEACRSFGIDYALETREPPLPGAPTLFMQLLHVETREVLWADRMNLATDALAATYKAMVLSIVDSVAGAIGRHQMAGSRLTRDPSAYRHYLAGLHRLRHIDLPDVRRARKEFRAALREDPAFAPARSGLSRTLHLEWLLTARGDAALLNEARNSAANAISADREDASGYRELGVVSLFSGAFDASIEAFEQAERIAPHHADLLADYADTLVHAASPEAALSKVEKAMDLNPLCPDLYLWTAAGANFFAQRYPAALGLLARMADQNPAQRLVAACHGMLGNAAEAGEAAQNVRETHPGFDIEQWLGIIPFREQWKRDQYREGLHNAGL